jgi:teichoic acid transport system permease protein
MTAGDGVQPPMRALTGELGARDYLIAMWQRRDFAIALPVEQMRSQHQDTLLGNIWHLGNPLLSVAVYYLVFGVMLGADRGIENFILWLAIGVFAYRLTQSTVQGGANSVTRNRGLMRSIRFPRALLPISNVISELLSFGFQLIVLALIGVLSGVPISGRWLFLPVIVAVHTALNLGVAFIAARLTDSYRDVDQVIPFVFRLLIYISGVMFPLEPFLESERAGPFIAHVIEYNPLVSILQLYRWLFLGTAVDIDSLLRLLVVSTVLLVFGFRYFRAGEYSYGLK